MTFPELYDSVKNFDVIKETSDILESIQDNILEMNRNQMWDGLTAKGEDIRPKYSENPFFKTKEQAAGYAKWKWAISSQGSKRDIDTPNLYINGYFYESLRFKKDELKIVTENALGAEVTSEHKDVLGLMPENINEVIEVTLQPKLTEKLQSIL